MQSSAPLRPAPPPLCVLISGSEMKHRYEVRSQRLVIGRSGSPQSRQKAHLGVGNFTSISRSHCTLRARVIPSEADAENGSSSVSSSVPTAPVSSALMKFRFRVLSKNGARVNGEYKKRNSTTILRDGDFFQVGPVLIQLCVPPSQTFSHEFVVALPLNPPKSSFVVWDFPRSDRDRAAVYDTYNSLRHLWRNDRHHIRPDQILRRRTSFLTVTDFDSDASPSESYEPNAQRHAELFSPEARTHLPPNGARLPYVDLQSCLLWTLLKVSTWNIRGGPLLDVRIEYGTDPSVLLPGHPEVIKWDLLYLGLRFFSLSDLLSLGTILNVRSFLSSFFQLEDLTHWRSVTHRSIRSSVLESCFVGLDVTVTHQELMGWLERERHILSRDRGGVSLRRNEISWMMSTARKTAKDLDDSNPDSVYAKSKEMENINLTLLQM